MLDEKFLCGLTVHFVYLSTFSLAKYSNLVAHFDYPSTKYFLTDINTHSTYISLTAIHFPMETTSYDRAWRAFRKENFGLCSTTYYSTVPITYTDTDWSYTIASFNKSLKRSSLPLIVTMNFTATIYCGNLSFCFARYRCNEVWLERYLGEISRILDRYLTDLSF